MTANCRQIGSIVLRFEKPFLDMPELTLTVNQARRFFDVDAATCQIVLEALEDARVLTRTPEGAYTRYFPHGRAGMAA